MQGFSFIEVMSGFLGHSSREKPHFCIKYRGNTVEGRMALNVRPVNEPEIPQVSQAMA